MPVIEKDDDVPVIEVAHGLHLENVGEVRIQADDSHVDPPDTGNFLSY